MGETDGADDDDRGGLAQVEHFSSYALMGVPDMDVSLVYARAVQVNASDSARGVWTDLITFTAVLREIAFIPSRASW